MRDDFNLIAHQVHGLTTLDIELSKLCVRDSWREIAERNLWSWRLRRGIIPLSAPYSIGTVSISAPFTSTIDGVGTAWDATMIGRQFRLSVTNPFYTIVDVPSPTALTIDPPWGGDTIASSTYSITSSYWTAPDDFFSLLSVTDSIRAWRLNLNVDQAMLDLYDPRRSSMGQPILLSPLDYSTSYSGRVYPVVRAYGSGSSPASYGSYTGVSDALFAIRIITGGAVGVATFQWHRDSLAFSSTTTTSSIGNLLSDGVGVSWPSSGTFVSGDVFIIRTSTQANPGSPRFEIYPSPQSTSLLPFYYVTTYSDLDDAGVTLPRYIPGTLVKEGALARAARIPNTIERPNPYAQIARAEAHENAFASLLAQEMQNDEEVFCRSISSDVSLPFAPFPWSRMAGGQLPIDFDPLFIYPSFR